MSKGKIKLNSRDYLSQSHMQHVRTGLFSYCNPDNKLQRYHANLKWVTMDG